MFLENKLEWKGCRGTWWANILQWCKTWNVVEKVDNRYVLEHNVFDKIAKSQSNIVDKDTTLWGILWSVKIWIITENGDTVLNKRGNGTKVFNSLAQNNKKHISF